MYEIGWFSTGRDQAACDLLATVQDQMVRGEIKAMFSFVFSNREPGEARESDLFFDLVRGYGIPLVCLSYQRFKAQRGTVPGWRLEYDREIMRRLEGYRPDLHVLAGYMLIVSAEMCQKYPMINLHPAAPGGPTGTWQEVIWTLIENRATESGVMMHLVTPELDKGPPLTYCTFSISGAPFAKHWRELERLSLAEVKAKQGENNPLFQLIRKHGLAREFPLIVTTIKACSEGRIRIEGGRIVTPNREVSGGYDLTQEIDWIVRGKL